MEELLISVIAFARRALGSIFLGAAALVKPTPSLVLLRLVATGRMLSWATLLVVSAAAFGALYVAPFQSTPLAWSRAVLQLTNVQTYLSRFVPALAVGVLFILIVEFAVGKRERRLNSGGMRLLASTIFALSVAAALTGALTLSFFTGTSLGNQIMKSSFMQSGRFPLTERDFFSGTIVWAVVLLCIACGIAGLRRGLEMNVPAVFRRRSRWVHFIAGLAFGCASATVPWILTLLIMKATTMAGPELEYFFRLPAIAEDVSRAERAEFFPYPAQCGLAKSESDSAHSALTCLLILHTNGVGHLFLGIDSPIFVVTRGIRGDPRESRFKLRPRNLIDLGRPADSEKVLDVEAGTLEFIDLKKNFGGVVRIELGKPIVMRLELPLPESCHDHVLAKYLRHGTAQHENLYIAAEPIALTETGGKFATLGPWRLPKSAFDFACRIGPASRDFALLTLPTM